jgi:DNA (cytosine-5)-methyltransferase 1
VWANDIDELAVATYNSFFRRHGAHAAVAGDLVRRFQAGELDSHIGVDLVVGGPPCQGFSVAGKMDPHDPRSNHVWTFLDVVKHLEPRGFVMENVSSLAWNKRWTGLLERLVERGELLGYRMRVLQLNASDFGVPQNRRRVFLVGLRDGFVDDPLPATADDPPTVRQALEILPTYGQPGNNTYCRARVVPAKRPVLRRSPYAGMLFNGKGRPLNLDAPAPTLPASMGGNKTPIIDQEELEHGVPAWVLTYHERLRKGHPSKKVAPRRLRRLTVEEAAALQTFPQNMKWFGRINQVFCQIGNAVPPRLAHHVALAVNHGLESSSQGASDPGSGLLAVA